MSQNNKTRNEMASQASVIMRYWKTFGFWIVVDMFFYWEQTRLSGWVKTAPGESILRVTRLNGKWCQNLVSNTAKLKFQCSKRGSSPRALVGQSHQLVPSVDAVKVSWLRDLINQSQVLMVSHTQEPRCLRLLRVSRVNSLVFPNSHRQFFSNLST